MLLATFQIKRERQPYFNLFQPFYHCAHCNLPLIKAKLKQRRVKRLKIPHQHSLLPITNEATGRLCFHGCLSFCSGEGISGPRFLPGPWSHVLYRGGVRYRGLVYPEGVGYLWGRAYLPLRPLRRSVHILLERFLVAIVFVSQSD